MDEAHVDEVKQFQVVSVRSHGLLSVMGSGTSGSKAVKPGLLPVDALSSIGEFITMALVHEHPTISHWINPKR